VRRAREWESPQAASRTHPEESAQKVDISKKETESLFEYYQVMKASRAQLVAG
jgi:hypothetical protein